MKGLNNEGIKECDNYFSIFHLLFAVFKMDVIMRMISLQSFNLYYLIVFDRLILSLFHSFILSFI